MIRPWHVRRVCGRLGRGWLLAAALLAGATCASNAQPVWFAPADNLPRGTQQFNHDFPLLFAEPAGWNTNIAVLVIAPYYAQRATDQDLLRIAAFLQAHHVALAVGSQPMQIRKACDFGEGRVAPGQNLETFRRLKKLGIAVPYVALDEPLTFGHYASYGNRPCHFPIAEVARRVALTIAEIRQSYPDMAVVDYEAPMNATASVWNADLPAWVAAYAVATGQAFHAVVLDMDWRQHWQDWAGPSIATLHRNKVQAGMFLTIEPPKNTDAAAAADLRQNINAVMAAHLPFDFTELASWNAHPAQNMPASNPDSMTGILAWYLRLLHQ